MSIKMWVEGLEHATGVLMSARETLSSDEMILEADIQTRRSHAWSRDKPRSTQWFWCAEIGLDLRLVDVILFYININNRLSEKKKFQIHHTYT